MRRLIQDSLTPATHKVVIPAKRASASASRDPGADAQAVALDPRVKPEGDVKSWQMAS